MKNSETKTNIAKIVSSMEITKRWEDRCSAKLVGKTIKYVRYQYTCEKQDLGWSKKALVIFFEDGSYLFPSSDDEGNNAGSLFTSIEGLEGIPAI
ncbi:MAG: hypothetical protein WCO84_05715 [bacterium]